MEVWPQLKVLMRWVHPGACGHVIPGKGSGSQGPPCRLWTTKNLRAELGWFSALPPLTVDELRLVWWKASQFPPLAFGLFFPYLFFPLLGRWHFPSAGGFPLAYKYAIIAHVKQTLPCLLVPLVLFFLVPLHRIPQEKFSILLLGPPHCTPTPEKLFLFRPLTANIF